jgi:hypothetical protein
MAAWVKLWGSRRIQDRCSLVMGGSLKRPHVNIVHYNTKIPNRQQEKKKSGTQL